MTTYIRCMTEFKNLCTLDVFFNLSYNTVDNKDRVGESERDTLVCLSECEWEIEYPCVAFLFSPHLKDK